MTDTLDRSASAGLLKSLDEVDREIVRLLHQDPSICEAGNHLAFEKLRGMLMMHFGLWEKAAQDLGPAWTSRIEQFVIERLANLHPDSVARLSAT